MASRNILVHQGSNYESNTEDKVNSIAERDAAGRSKAKMWRATSGLESDGWFQLGVGSKAVSFTIDDVTNIAAVWLCDTTSGDVTVTLPAVATSTGRRYTFVKSNAANSLILDPPSSEAINGATTYTIKNLYGRVTVVCDGTAWFIESETPAFSRAINCPLNADNVDQAFFIADRSYLVTRIDEIHATAGTDGSAVSLQVTKDTGTNAPGAGTDLLTNNTNVGFDLKATINTVQNGTLVTSAATLTLAAGNRLSLDYAGVITSLAGVVVQVMLVPI